MKPSEQQFPRYNDLALVVEIFNNIRNLYRFIDPCPELAGYVEFFAESSPEATKKYISADEFSVRMFASWTPTFFINLGASYRILSGDCTYRVNAGQGILVLRNSIVERYNRSTDNVFTIKFLPGGLEAVLGVSQLISKDRIVDLRSILPQNLLESLQEPIPFEERYDIMQTFLLASFARRKKKDHYLQFVQDCIGYNPFEIQWKTSLLAEKMFVSSRTINRYFNRVVGISPKSYLSLLRARAALAAYIGDKKLFSPFDFGYYDLSHFYKEIRNFTGKKLTEQDSFHG
jgi:AraC-like DNA-binding protein